MNNNNSNYVTINNSGIFYDQTYVKIENTLRLFDLFEHVNRFGPIVKEFQIIASDTPGIYGRYGIPKTNHGPNAWCRAVFCNDAVGPWVFRRVYNSTPECVKKCLYDCLYDITLPTNAFSKAVLDKNVALINALKINDLSLFDNKTLEINGYKITINKIKTK